MAGQGLTEMVEVFNLLKIVIIILNDFLFFK